MRELWSRIKWHVFYGPRCINTKAVTGEPFSLKSAHDFFRLQQQPFCGIYTDQACISRYCSHIALTYPTIALCFLLAAWMMALRTGHIM